MERNTPFDAQPFGGVAGTGHDAPFSAGNQGPALEFRMDDLFAGGKEGVSIDMEDGSRPRMQGK